VPPAPASFKIKIEGDQDPNNDIDAVYESADFVKRPIGVIHSGSLKVVVAIGVRRGLPSFAWTRSAFHEEFRDGPLLDTVRELNPTYFTGRRENFKNAFPKAGYSVSLANKAIFLKILLVNMRRSAYIFVSCPVLSVF
jgi:hypothetical protein